MTRKRDKHKKSDQESSQATIAEEPETEAVDEETLRREREEARRRWFEEQRRKYPVAPDGKNNCYCASLRGLLIRRKSQFILLNTVNYSSNLLYKVYRVCYNRRQ
jgi:hypothetical protein